MLLPEAPLGAPGGSVHAPMIFGIGTDICDIRRIRAVLARRGDRFAERVELYTETYAAAHGTPQQGAVLARFTAAAEAALRAGLEINAGHDLNRANLTDFLRGVPGVLEVSIGHALVADALELGITETVRDYQRRIQAAFAPVSTSPGR